MIASRGTATPKNEPAKAARTTSYHFTGGLTFDWCGGLGHRWLCPHRCWGPRVNQVRGRRKRNPGTGDVGEGVGVVPGRLAQSILGDRGQVPVEAGLEALHQVH